MNILTKLRLMREEYNEQFGHMPYALYIGTDEYRELAQAGYITCDGDTYNCLGIETFIVRKESHIRFAG